MLRGNISFDGSLMVLGAHVVVVSLIKLSQNPRMLGFELGKQWESVIIFASLGSKIGTLEIDSS